MCWSALVCVGVGWYVLGWWPVLAWVGMYCCWLVCLRVGYYVLVCIRVFWNVFVCVFLLRMFGMCWCALVRDGVG